MKFAEINKMFTEIVNEYISKGYYINTGSMGGSQGEIAKVHLTDGKELICVYITHTCNKKVSYAENTHFLEVVEIVVGRSNAVDAVSAIDKRGFFATVWLDNLEIIKTKTFYSVARRKEFYTTDVSEAIVCEEKRYNRGMRRSRRSNMLFTSVEAREIAKRYIKRKAGYKRVSVDEIHIVKNINEKNNRANYAIIYKGEVIF